MAANNYAPPAAAPPTDPTAAAPPSIMQSAQSSAPAATGPSFTPKDPRQFVPPEQHDAVERVFAAGMKLMYSPQMADERQQALQSQEPAPKKIADNVTGLLLTLDQQAKGGIPEQAIFPAGVMLANEAGNMLVHAGQPVSQDAYNESLQILYVQLGKKLGASDDQLMQGAQDALAKKQGGMDPEQQASATGTPVAPGKPAPPTGGPPGGAMPPGMPPTGMPPQGGA